MHMYMYHVANVYSTCTMPCMCMTVHAYACMTVNLIICICTCIQGASSTPAKKAGVSGRNGSAQSAKESTSSKKESEDNIHYWVPRVRLMFAAEDPTVFARRVAHAHMTRYTYMYL